MNFSKLIELSNEWKKEVCLFGTGRCGSGWGYDILKALGFDIKYYIDNYSDQDVCNGVPVHDAEFLKKDCKDILCIVTVYGNSGVEIIEQLKKIGVTNYYWLHDGEDIKEDLPQYIDELGDRELIKKFRYIMDDKEYLKRRFKERMGYELNFEKPRTFNEKLQWLKIYDRKPLYTTMVDKYEVKEYVSGLIGAEYVIPTVGIYDSFEEINFDNLPNRFVLKCTHDSGSIVFCRDKNNFDIEKAKDVLEASRKRNYFWPDREWPYYNVPRRIIAEEMIGAGEKNLNVYKIFNFSGKPELIQVIQNDKTSEESIDYYDVNWNLLDLRQNFPNSEVHLDKPKELDKMLKLAGDLSKGHPFIRTDFYIVDGKIYFSEFTFFSDSGAEKFHPEEWDYRLGDLIILK